MIIVGYQGIGKSTLAKNSYKYIDLESGNFWIDGVRHDDWYKAYCKIAAHLSAQGHTVLVSSHYVVREELKKYSEEVKCCFPSVDLQEEWIKKLEDRYNESKLEKDFKAWQNAYNSYFENIYDLMESGFDNIIIRSMDYDLRELIEENE